MSPLQLHPFSTISFKLFNMFYIVGVKRSNCQKGSWKHRYPTRNSKLLHVYQNFRSASIIEVVVVLCVSNVFKNSYYKIALFVPDYKDLK